MGPSDLYFVSSRNGNYLVPNKSKQVNPFSGVTFIIMASNALPDASRINLLVSADLSKSFSAIFSQS